MGQKSRDCLLLSFLTLSALLYYLSYYNCNIIYLDQGYLLQAAMRVMNGEVPFRDFHSDYPPGSYYFLALIFKIFGVKYNYAWMSWVFIHTASVLLAYFITRRFVPPFPAFAASLFVLAVPGPWHKSFFIFLPLLNLFMVFKILEKKNYKWVIAEAFIVVVSCFIRQDVGLYCCVVFLAALGLMKDKRLFLTAVAAGIFFSLPIIFYYYSKGALPDMLSELATGGIKDTSAMNIPFPPVIPRFPTDLLAVLKNELYYLPFIIYPLCAIYLVRKWSALKEEGKNIHFLLFMLLGMMLLSQLINRSDMPHLWQVLPPLYLLSVILFNALKRITAATLTALLLALVLYTALQDPTSGSIALRAGCDTALDLPTASIYLPRQQVSVIRKVLQFIKTNSREGSYILAVPDIPMFYFLSERKDPIKFQVLLIGTASSPADQADVIRDIQAKEPRVCVLDTEEVDNFIPKRRFRNYSLLVYSYLMSHYKEVDSAGPFALMVKI
ncbi:MAG: hypothetical protein WA666_06540 [Nitrospirota bacterium]